MTRRRGHEGEYEKVLAATGTETKSRNGHYTYERTPEMKGEGDLSRNCTSRKEVLEWRRW